MLIFVLGAAHAAAAGATEANIRAVAPGWTVVPVAEETGKHMNRSLAAYDEAFFMTLHAGVLIRPEFAAELLERLPELPDRCCGLIFDGPNEQSSRLQGPVLWRTQAVLGDGPVGFAERDALPFDEYVLIDMKHRLSRQWNWSLASSVWWQPAAINAPSWQRAEEQRALIRPLLEADTTAAPFAAEVGSPAICIAICTYNNAEYLPWAVHSVLAQRNPHWTLCLIDDASTDGTRALLEAYKDRNDPRIHIHTNEINRGKSYCLNQALQQTSADWLLELDADDWLSVDCIGSLLAAAQVQDAQTGLLHGDHYDWLERARKQLLFRGIMSGSDTVQRDLLVRHAVPLIPRCYRTSALRQIGGWNTKSLYEGRLYEDLEIILRLTESYSAIRIPQPLYHRRNRTASITKQNSAKYVDWAQWIQQSMKQT